MHHLIFLTAGEVKRLKAYKPWAAQVAASPPPTTDPLAPPKKSKKVKQAGGSDELALVAAIKSKVRGSPRPLSMYGYKHWLGWLPWQGRGRVYKARGF
jgi:hypothetical protein